MSPVKYETKETVSDIDGFQSYLEKHGVRLSGDGSRWAVYLNPDVRYLGLSEPNQLKDAMKHLEISQILLFNEGKKKITMFNKIGEDKVTGTTISYEEFMKTHAADTERIIAVLKYQ